MLWSLLSVRFTPWSIGAQFDANNAAVLNEKPLEAIGVGDIERIMAVNFVAAFILS